MNVRLTQLWMLTSEHPQHPGFVVLVQTEGSGTAYGPADRLELPAAYGGPQAAAQLVVLFARHLDAEGREVARRFCQRWPDGPQLSD